ALIKQYQRFFEMEDAELIFTEKALHCLAKQALKRNTGARALRAITEELMVDLMYELPDQPKPGKYVIDEEDIKNKTEFFLPKLKKESA
ncbi:MAG TPA: hypothetical protein PLP05_08635, partial [Sedimentisphaerales bacterium]|nr:hypothetical protein [Sedimentisphaerales bacterium]